MTSAPDSCNPTALSYWLPTLLKAGFPVPKTTILQMSEAAQADVWNAFDGKDGTQALLAFCDEVKAAGAVFGSSFFRLSVLKG